MDISDIEEDGVSAGRKLAKDNPKAAAGLSEAPPVHASIKGPSLNGRCSTQEKNVLRASSRFSTWGNV